MTPSERTDRLNDLCASYQQAVIEQLIIKTKHVLQQNNYKSIGLSGGVSNNQVLRTAFKKLAYRSKVESIIARPEHTGDNAAMIAFAALVEAHNHKIMYDSQPSIPLLPSLKINQCP